MWLFVLACLLLVLYFIFSKDAPPSAKTFRFNSKALFKCTFQGKFYWPKRILTELILYLNRKQYAKLHHVPVRQLTDADRLRTAVPKYSKTDPNDVAGDNDEANLDAVTKQHFDAEQDFGQQLANYLGQQLKRERVHRLAEDTNAFQEVDFTGVHANGSLLLVRMVRRQNEMVDLRILLKHFEHGCLVHNMYPHSRTTIRNFNGGFEAGGLRFMVVEANRQWKISFNGQMKRLEAPSSSVEDSWQHVQFIFYWHAVSQVCDFDSVVGDTNGSLLCDAIARDPWSCSLGKAVDYVQQKLLPPNNNVAYEQVGEMIGLIQRHSYGVAETVNRQLTHRIHLLDGYFINAGAVSSPSRNSHTIEGYIFRPNGFRKPLEQCDLSLWERKALLKITGDSRTLRITPSEELAQFSTFENGLKVLTVVRWVFAVATGNGRLTQGIVEERFRLDSNEATALEAAYPSPPEKLPPVIQLSIGDQVVQLDGHEIPKGSVAGAHQIGGKGYQLMVLKQFCTEKVPPMFKVTDGFVLTTFVYEQHIDGNGVKELVNGLKRAVFSRKDFSVEQEQIELAILSKTFEFDPKTIQEMKQFLNTGKRYAVRSSATDEDGTDVSVAGQERTELNVEGNCERIVEAVRKCWASHFSREAVIYRHSNGIPIDSAMAIVVQEMVENVSTSGVLFTMDPVTLDPSHMVINAAHGLGEAVVSGEIDPDTFVVTQRQPRENFTFEIIERRPAKTLSDSAGQLFLLQARPVTATEQQLFESAPFRELDTALSCDEQWLTRANVQEVMWGAKTPLGALIQKRGISQTADNIFIRDGYIDSLAPERDSAALYTNLAYFINLSSFEIFTLNPLVKKRNFEMGLCGHDNPEITEDHLLYFHGQPSFLRKLSMVYSAFRLWSSKARKRAEQLEQQLIEKPHYPSGKTALEAIQIHASCFSRYMINWGDAIGGFQTAMAFIDFVFGIITSTGDGTWTDSHYGDLSLCLRNSKAISAQVAPAIQELAAAMRQVLSEEQLNQFLTASDANAAMEELRSLPPIRNRLNDFFLEFGHRSLREFEPREPSWARDATTLFVTGPVTSIRSHLTAAPDDSKSHESIDETPEETIKSLSCYPLLSGIQKMILKWLIPKARAGVALREKGKSLMIRVEEQIKVSILELGHHLESEGLIPDADLVHFFTPHELVDVVATKRSCVTHIRSAKRRRRIHPQLEKFRCAELHQGVPKGILQEEIEAAKAQSGPKMFGTPVSRGQAKAKVTVAHSFEDVVKIERGDILVTHHTDIGWSPYFPLLSGLVTEVGGVISHGPSIARECNIPCLSNVAFATDILQTGETIFVDGAAGYLMRLSDDV